MLINRKYFRVLCIIVTLTVGLTLGLLQTKPPRVNRFSPMFPSYERMMANLQKLTEKPHPSGSKEIEIVRAHLLSEIENMGLSPFIQSAFYTIDEYVKNFIYKQQLYSSIEDHWETVKDNAKQEGIYTIEEFKFFIKDLLAAVPDENFTLDEIIDNYYMKLKYSSIEEYYETVKEILKQYDIYSFEEFDKSIGEYYEIKVNEEGILSLQNIIVKLDAPGTESGVLFAAHYDSEAQTQGAADNMLAVVSILEALRSQAQNNSIKTDLYFLFTDGEELGLLGAFIFINENPEMKDKIEMVINFDARGNSGALTMFETSPNAYNLVSVYKKSGAWLYGFSASTELYNMMPKMPGTDFIAFLQESYSGLNFAIIEGVKAYHYYDLIPDSHENLNRDTAWHHLQVTYSLANYTANNSMDNLRQQPRNAVFFPFLPGKILLMTDTVSHILCVLACVLALAVIALNIVKKRFKPSVSMIIMCFLVPLSIICSIFLTAANYLFYIPLLLLTVISFIKKWQTVHFAVKMVSCIIILMLWIPIIITIWQAIIMPMII